MDVRQCRQCRKLFQYRGNPMCPNCLEELDKLFNKVRNYIYDNPSSGMDEICAETGADDATISMWLREGRLILSMDNAALLKCEGCGEPIRSGRFCEICAKSMKDRLESAARAISPKTGSGDKAPDIRPGARMHVDIGKK